MAELYDHKGNPLQVQNVDKTPPKRVRLKEQLKQHQQHRVKQDVDRWRKAIAKAENIRRPERRELFKVYRDLLLDAHITATLETRRNNIVRKPLKVVNQEGEEQPDLTEILQKPWVRRFREMTFDAKPWGFTVVSLGRIVADEFPDMEEIPREHIIPEWMMFRERMGTRPSIRIDEPPYSNWNIFIGSQTDLGLLNHIAFSGIVKKNSFGAWADYNQIFGIPIVLGYTTGRDEKEQRNFENALSNLHNDYYAVLDKEVDDIKVEESAGGRSPTFDSFVKLCNKEISKVILGQTMTTEDGSSKSQGEVHERVMYAYEEADAFHEKTVLNHQLLPRLVFHGIMPEGVRIEHDDQEVLSLEARWDIANELIKSNQYRVPPEWIDENFGIPVELAPQGPQPSFGGGEGGPSAILNKGVDDYPEEAVENARLAMEWIKNDGRNRGSKNARQIAKRLIKRERLGIRTLRDIRSYARYRKDSDKDFAESPASLNFYLVGGVPMVDNFAPQAIERLRQGQQAKGSTEKMIEDAYPDQ